MNISDVGADPLGLNCPVGRGGSVEQRCFCLFPVIQQYPLEPLKNLSVNS